MKKIKNYIKLISFIAVVSFATSCEDNLELSSEQGLEPDEVVSTPGNVEDILLGIYDEAGQVASYGGRLNLASELMANGGDLIWRGTFQDPAQFNRQQVLTNNVYNRSFWTNAYEVNHQANIVLANLSVFENETRRQRVEGEAKFLRALAYFDLARFFCKQYDATTASEDLGVPIVFDIVLDPSQVKFPERNTLQEVYDLVISDLRSAIDLLPVSNGEFADKYAAEALLARVYFQQRRYEEARDAANNVINNAGKSLAIEYGFAFNNSENSTEDIFAWQITVQDGTNDMNTFWATRDFGGRSSNGDVRVSSSFFDVFGGDTNDARAGFFYNGNRNTMKWQSQFANIPFIRLAEMYLIRAESNVIEGSSIGQSAMEDINALRGRAGANLLTTAPTLEDVRNERRRELAFEGFALHDIKRTMGTVGTLNYDDNSLVMPIPQRERDANPNIEQNPGYAQ